MKRRAVLCVALLVTGCTVGPNYKAPDLPVKAGFDGMTSASPALSSVPAASEVDLSKWWTQFGDAELEHLIARAMASNLDLMTAASRVEDAREQEVEAGAAGQPQLSASGYAAHFHSNSNPLAALVSGEPSSSGSTGQAAHRGTDLKLYSAGFDATWEIDVFGGTRRSVEAARANSESELWQMRDGEVMLTAEIATNYFTIRALQERIEILKSEARRQGDLLTLVSARHRAGFVTQLDVNQQISLQASTVAEIPALEAQVGAGEHAIAVLLGEDPDAVVAELDVPAPSPPVPDTIPVGLPSDLLRRRPDIREAERKLAAATAQIGVAVANLYPKFDLVGAASFAGNHLSNLLSSNNLSEVGLGSIIWPIFHGGQIRADIDSKKDEADQAYFAYKKTVLTAIQNVEDALLRYASDQVRIASLERAVKSGNSSAVIARVQYLDGLVTYVNVLTAQANTLSAEDQLEQARASLATDLVSLYKALGGGWSISPAPETITSAHH